MRSCTGIDALPAFNRSQYATASGSSSFRRLTRRKNQASTSSLLFAVFGSAVRRRPRHACSGRFEERKGHPDDRLKDKNLQVTQLMKTSHHSGGSSATVWASATQAADSCSPVAGYFRRSSVESKSYSVFFDGRRPLKLADDIRLYRVTPRCFGTSLLKHGARLALSVCHSSDD